MMVCARDACTTLRFSSSTFFPSNVVVAVVVAIFVTFCFSFIRRPSLNSIYACRVRCIFIFLRFPSSLFFFFGGCNGSPKIPYQQCVGSTSTQNMPLVRSLTQPFTQCTLRIRQNHATKDNLSFRCNRSIFSSCSVSLLQPPPSVPPPLTPSSLLFCLLLHAFYPK